MLKSAENNDNTMTNLWPQTVWQCDSVRYILIVKSIFCDNCGWSTGLHHKQYKVKLYDIITTS